MKTLLRSRKILFETQVINVK